MTVPPFRSTIADVGRGLCLVSVSGELDLYVGPLTGVDDVVRTFPTLHDALQTFLLEPAV